MKPMYVKILHNVKSVKLSLTAQYDDVTINPTRRTVAILKIVISLYLSRESSEYDEIWYADANFDPFDGNVTKIQKFPNSRWRTDAILKIIFLAITRLHIVRLRRNFEFGGIIALTRRLGDENVKFRKPNMVDCRILNFEF